MLKQMLKKMAFKIAPGWTEECARYVWLCRQARLLGKQCKGLTVADLVARVDQFDGKTAFQAIQKQTEAVALLTLLQERSPRTLCEIGSAGGGMLFLLAQVAAPEARILSIDIGYSWAKRKAYPLLCQPGQRLNCLARDSHAPATVMAVERWLGGRQFDFLFIDGDHSLAGVKSDYTLYAPYVRPGGIVAFHDIVPNPELAGWTADRGPVPKGAADPGQVPEFWAGLKEHTAGMVWEFIADRRQQGYGIGVMQL